MRRADRLFQVIELLRRGGTVTAAELAQELEVSDRTVYRDIRDLMASGVPIDGEAGVGYALNGFDLPPVMFDQDEIEALAFGMRIVQTFGDSELGRAARSAISKIEAVLPDERRTYVEGTPLFAQDFRSKSSTKFDIAILRRAIRETRYVVISYTDAKGATTERRIRPLGMAFFGASWLLMAWCELRQDFRAFRPDRIERIDVRDELFEDLPPKDLGTYVARLHAECGAPCEGLEDPAPSADNATAP